MTNRKQKVLNLTEDYLESAKMFLYLQKELFENFANSVESEPIYQLSLDDKNWKDVTKKDFQSAKNSGKYKHRIVYSEQPTQKKFDLVRLERSEINLLWDQLRHPEDFARAIENKLAEKNL